MVWLWVTHIQCAHNWVPLLRGFWILRDMQMLQDFAEFSCFKGCFCFGANAGPDRRIYLPEGLLDKSEIPAYLTGEVPGE